MNEPSKNDTSQIDSLAVDRERDVLDRLMDQMHQRADELPEGSYTTKLMRGGDASIGKKIIEEANETIEAAENLTIAKSNAAGSAELAKARQHLVYEACDTIYHLWVLMGYHGISFQELRRELQRREGTSGLVEKASRKPNG